MASPVLERFLRYVAYDTQSREGASTYPSTSSQLVLLRDLVAELRAMGVGDAAMACPLAPSPFDDYYAQVQAGTRLAGRVIWGVEFDIS